MKPQKKKKIAKPAQKSHLLALAKKVNPSVLTLAPKTWSDRAVHGIKMALVALSEPLALHTTPKADLVSAWDFLKDLEHDLDVLREQARKEIMRFVLETGQGTSEDRGSKALQVGDRILRVTVTKDSILDPKKCEALLRAKGFDPAKHMDAVVTYKAKESGLNYAVSCGDVTQEEADSCRKPVVYRVDHSEPVGKTEFGRNILGEGGAA